MEVPVMEQAIRAYHQITMEFTGLPAESI